MTFFGFLVAGVYFLGKIEVELCPKQETEDDGTGTSLVRIELYLSEDGNPVRLVA